jgi:AbrB family looped-hinge helix DNA binding protein
LFITNYFIKAHTIHLLRKNTSDIIKIGNSLLFLFLGGAIMATKAFTDNAKVMSKGQITIPKDVRKILGVDCGDRVTFIVEGNTVRLVNSTLYAMQMLQAEMKDEAERANLTEDDVINMVKEVRAER